MSAGVGKRILIVDAAYLFQGAQKLQKRTGRKIHINNNTMRVVVEFMEQLTQSQFDVKYYITAEKSESSAWYREGFYEQLSSLGFVVDIRKFK